MITTTKKEFTTSIGSLFHTAILIWKLLSDKLKSVCNFSSRGLHQWRPQENKATSIHEAFWFRDRARHSPSPVFALVSVPGDFSAAHRFNC